MNREILIQRVQSIAKDIRILNKAVENMDVTNIPLVLENYKDFSAEAAQRAEWVAVRLRHLVYVLPFNPKRDYLPQAADIMGIKIEQREGMYELTLPGLMPKMIRRLVQDTGKPVIAGGLISDKEDVTNALSAGAVAVSTTNPAVWRM